MLRAFHQPVVCNVRFQRHQRRAFYAGMLQFSPVKGMSLVFQGSRARTRAWYAPGNPTGEAITDLVMIGKSSAD